MAVRGPYPKGQERRREIIRTALEVFAEAGYSGTSLREVARRIGISMPGLLHHFSSKEELLVQVLRERDAVDVAVAVAGGAGEHRPAELVVEIVRRNADLPGIVEVYATMAAAAAQADHPARPYFEHHFAYMTDTIAAWIRDGQASGELAATGDPAFLARTFVAIADGLQLQWLVDGSVDMAADLEAALRLLVAPVAPPIASA